MSKDVEVRGRMGRLLLISAAVGIAAHGTLAVSHERAAVAAAAGSASPTDGAAAATATAVRVTMPPRTVLVVAGGDVLNESLVNDSGAAFAAPGERYDFAPVFAPVAPLIASADLAICHAEIPIGAPMQRPGVYGRSPFGGNLLLAPYELAAGLARTGFDRCSTASNHSFDLGAPGIVSTLAALDDAGIGHVGTARSPAEAEPEVLTVNGVRLAHLSYTRGSNTVWPRDPWVLNRAATPRQVAADATRVRSAGAELVLVSLHIGTEMQFGPTSVDRAFATDLTALASIDLLVHHGPHVVQPVEVVNGTVVYWSVGNFVSAMGRPGTGRYEDPRALDGLLAAVRFVEGPSGRFTARSSPVLICNERYRRIVHPPALELADPVTAAAMPPSLRAELEACARRNPSFQQ